MKTQSSKGRASSGTKLFAPKRVLVPVDFSRLSETAIAQARGIAAQFGAKIHLLHVVEPLIHPVEYAIIPREMADINTQIMTERKTRLAEVKNQLADEGADCVTDLKVGKPWHAIVDYAKRAKCDLIVIATHGHTGPKHLLLGSTAERVVQHAPCSVLVVR